MQLLVIYHWIEGHCCPYLFNDVLFPLVMNYRVATSFPCDSGDMLAATAQTLCSRDLVAAILGSCSLPLGSCVGSPLSRTGMLHPLCLGKKDIISKKNIYSYLLGASEEGMVKRSLMRQHFIHYIPSFQLPFGHTKRICST